MRSCAEAPDERRLDDQGIARGEVVISGEIGVADQRADAGAAVGEKLDGAEAFEAADMDKPRRPGDAGFHQIDEIGAAGEIRGAFDRSRRDGLVDAARL